MLTITLLGTAATMPLPDRALSAAFAACGGHGLLWDCGEGTQAAARRAGVNLMRADAICLTHYHGDHIFGLPGLLQTLGAQGRTRPLALLGPEGLPDIWAAVRALTGPLPYPVKPQVLMPGQPLALDALSEGWPAGARLVPFATKHRVKSLGYRLELPRAGKFSPEQAQVLGVPVQQWKLLQKGQSVAVEGRTVQPAQVLGAPRKGLSVVFSGDTAPCPYYLQAAHDADLLICDATYALPEQEDQARQWGHSTFGQSATLAAQARAKRLWLTHYSPMITDPEEGAAELLDTLHRAGYAAYVVGGCVRDSLLGLTPHDWDLCTSALPQQVMELFGAQRCIPTGLQHGTVTVKQSGALYEITTFRTEGTYTDGRHPDEVHFVPDVREDLARRDFTINAMAYNEKEGLVDPFGGQADLQSGIVRAVGVPRQRFTEDALRILRLYRFAARFGFAIDPPTAQAAQELCAHLDCVSVERIEEELAKLLSAPAPAAYLDKKILLVILPELSSEALAAAKPVVDACPAGAENLPIRLAALLYSLGEDGIRRTLKRLRCSNALIEEAAVLVREARRRDGSFLFGHEYGLRHPADASCFEQHSHPAGRCSNSNSLFPPQAAVVAVAGHSIARPIAFGNRVPPQRTVLRETTDSIYAPDDTPHCRASSQSRGKPSPPHNKSKQKRR